MANMSRTVVARNFSIQVVSRILAVLVGLGSIAILTRSLGTQAFGEYTTAITFLQLFGVIVDFGLTLTLIVMISEQDADAEKIVGNIFGLRMISGVIIFSIAPIVVLSLPWSDVVKESVLIGSLAYVLMGGATLLVGVFQRYHAMWRAGLAEILNRVALLIFIALFAYFKLGVIWMIAASVIANAVWLYSMIHLARPFVHIHFLTDISIWKKVWARSWPIAVSVFFNLLYLKGDILFLAYFREQTEVGIYGVTYRVLDMLTALPVMFMGILLPIVVNTWSSGNKDEFRAHVARTFDLFMIAAVPIIIGTQHVAKPLMRLIAGPGYEASGDILKLLIFAVFGVFLGALFGHLVVALNKQKPMTWGYVSVAIVTVVGYFLFIPRFGMWGAAWMTLVSEWLIALITFLVVYKVAHIKLRFSVTAKALTASFVMFVVLQLLPSFTVLIDILVAAIVYIAIMILIKGIRIEDIHALKTARASLE